MNPKPSREETLFFAAAEMGTPEMRAAAFRPLSCDNLQRFALGRPEFCQ